MCMLCALFRIGACVSWISDPPHARPAPPHPCWWGASPTPPPPPRARFWVGRDIYIYISFWFEFQGFSACVTKLLFCQTVCAALENIFYVITPARGTWHAQTPVTHARTHTPSMHCLLGMQISYRLSDCCSRHLLFMPACHIFT